MKQYYLKVLILLFSLISGSFCRGNTLSLIAENKVWSTLSNPISVYYKGEKEQTYFAFIDGGGNVVAASYNHKTDTYTEQIVKSNVYTNDYIGYASPSILIRGEGEILLFFQDFSISSESGACVISAYRSTNKEDISTWTSMGNTAYADIFYPCPSSSFIVGNDIYVSFRGKRGPAFFILPGGNNPSHANYNTLSNTTTQGNRFEFYQIANNSTAEPRLQIPYTISYQDNEGAIHLLLLHSDPSYTGTDNNTVHYLKLKNKQFYTAAGTSVANLAVAAIPMTNIPDKIYVPTGNKKSWIWDICVDGTNPVVLYATFNEDGNDYTYHYAKWNGTSWSVTKIADAGGILDTNRPYLSGGISFDSKNPSIVYVSQKGADTFEINKYSTSDNGATWNKKETLSTEKNVMNIFPVSVKNYPENSPIDLFWMKDKGLSKIELEEKTLIMTEGDSKELSLTLTPASTFNKNVIWESSNPEIASVSQKGLVKALKKGKATITVKSVYNPAMMNNCEVTVNALVVPELVSEDIAASMKKVADWQMSNFTYTENHDHGITSWTKAVLYIGLAEWAKIASNSNTCYSWLYDKGEKGDWATSSRYYPYHADELCVGQFHLAMYDKYQEEDMIKDIKSRADYIIKTPPSNQSMSYQSNRNLWTWCDALFMAPPVYAKLTNITKDDKYVDYMDAHFKKTFKYLYDTDEDLIFRDNRFFTQKEPNGEKVFWGRGNGWTVAGVALILQQLPQDSKYREYYEDILRTMTLRLIELQTPDGSWHPSLLDPDSYPSPETSATALITYAIAYALNNNLLTKEEAYIPLSKAWDKMGKAIHENGKLGYVQPVGHDPSNAVTYDMTATYGIGAFLLAGTEIYNYLQPKTGIDSIIDNNSLDEFISSETKITIFSIQGQKIGEEILGFKSYDTIVKNKNLENGVYLINFQLNKKSKTIKYISSCNN